MNDPKSKFKIVTLGVMTRHKGADLLIETASLARTANVPVHFELIGSFRPPRADAIGLVREIGAYEKDELAPLLRLVDPDLVWFPVRMPETFSYTLSAALESGAPIFAPSIGAFPERLANRPLSWIYPWTLDAALVVEFLGEILAQLPKARQRLGERDSFVPLNSFYNLEYSDRGKASPTPASGGWNGKLRVAAIESTSATGQLQACGYIRVRLPLRHSSMSSSVHLVPADRFSALRLQPSALLIQRNAVTDVVTARKLIAHCRNNGISLLYETDDDLFNLPLTHPEAAHDRILGDAAKTIASAADAILVSTEPLSVLMRQYSDRVTVLPNALDENIWFGPASQENQVDTDPTSFRILYMGSPTHHDDLEMLRIPMQRLQKYFGDRVRLEVIGGSNNPGGWYDVLHVPGEVALSYPQFVSWLRARATRWRLGVCPLVDSNFNRSKSFIKYLDYAGLGLPSIVSAIVAFQPLKGNGAPGLFVDNEVDCWVEAIAALVSDDEYRLRLARETHAYVGRKHTLSAQASFRSRVWSAIFRAPRPVLTPGSTPSNG